MSILEAQVARVYKPLLNDLYRYKGAYGGRGSGKSWFFAQQIVLKCIQYPGSRHLCVRQFQKTLADSSKKDIEDAIERLGVSDQFSSTKENIRTPGGGVILFTGMQEHNKESVKSLSGCMICWIEEAQTLQPQAFDMLRATMFRVPHSEIWASWNPTRNVDAIDKFFRSDQRPDDAIAVKANWADNPWFPAGLKLEREHDHKTNPEWYPHKWEGEYASAFLGAYFAGHLMEAQAQGRITRLARDPLLPIRAYWDLGGAGANADAMAIWIVQYVGQEIRVLDFITGLGQPLAYYTHELRSRGWEKAVCVLPHDGINANNISGKQYWHHLADSGFDVPPPQANLGTGAASMRIEAVRRIFPKCWFDEDRTRDGRQALGFYHERKHPTLGHGMGPEHDWSSHAADAFGLMAVCYEDPGRRKGGGRLDMSQWGAVA